MGQVFFGEPPLLPDSAFSCQHGIIQPKLVKPNRNINEIPSRNRPWSTSRWTRLRVTYGNTEPREGLDLPFGAILSPSLVIRGPDEERVVSVAGVGVLGENVAEDGIEEAAVALGLVLEAAPEKYRGETDVVVVKGTRNVTGREPKRA